jgi:hypothetical protein
LAIKINWSFPNGTPDSYAGTQAKTTGQTSYSVSGTKTAVASVTAGGATQDVTCSPLKVNGQKIEGCKCMPTNIQPDVSKGELATWTASGCTSKANITGYTWKGATADATGLVATAPVAAKDDEVKGVSFTVENDDSTAVTIQCDDAKAIDATKPDFLIEAANTGIEVPAGEASITIAISYANFNCQPTGSMVGGTIKCGSNVVTIGAANEWYINTPCSEPVVTVNLPVPAKCAVY